MILLALILVGFVGCEIGEQSGISFMTWSPDGRSLASIYQNNLFIAEACEFGTVRVFEQLDVAEDHLAWSADSKQIAFAGKAAGSWDLWVLNVEKGEKKQLTRHPARECRPVWTPSCKALYFVSWRSGRPDIWRFDVQTQKEDQVTDDGLEEMALNISQRGDRLSFLAEDEEGRRSAFVMDLPSQQRLRLTGPAASLQEAALSPAGDQLAYLDGTGIHVVAVRFASPGGKPAPPGDKLIEPLARSKGKAPSALSDLGWSPTGKAIVFLKSGQVMVASLGLFASTRPLVPSPGGDQLPVWSPCDDRVAYVAGARADHPIVTIADIKKDTRDWLVGDIAGATAAARYCMAVNSTKEGIRLLDQALRQSPEAGPARDEAVELLCSAYFKGGQYEKLLDIHRDVTKDSVALGLVYMFCYQDFQSARRSFEEVPGRSEEAARYLRVLKEYPPRTLGLFCSAELSTRREEYSKAVERMRQFLRAAPDSSLAEGVAFDLGDVLWQNLKRARKAFEAYAAALQRYPDSDLAVAAHRSRAEILWQGFRNAQGAVGELDLIVEKLMPDERVECLGEIAEIWTQSGNLRLAVDADWRLIAELIRQDRAAHDQTPSQVGFRERKRLDVFLKGLKRTAGKDPALAIQDAARLPDLKLKSEDVRPVALPMTLAVLDEAGLHVEANALLKNPSLRAEIFFRYNQTAPEWLKVLAYAPKDVLREARLGSLPSWITDRLESLADHLKAQPQTDEVAALAAMLRIAAARTPDQVAEIAGALPKPHPTKEAPINYILYAQVTAAYVLGNYYQTQGDMARSLYEYDRMVKRLEEEPTLTAFGAATFIFDKCRRLLDKEPAAVKEWLDLERRACQTVWGVFEPIFGQQDWSQEYRDFLLRHPQTALADDVYYRLGGCGAAPQREVAYEKLLSAFPSSPLFAAALSDLEELHAKSGNDWLTARFAEELEKQPTHAQDAPLLELEQAKVYGLALKRPDLAIPHLDAVISKYPTREEWAEAQQVYATLCSNAKRWADALAHIEALVSRQPDFEWVRSGDALLKMAECKEKLGRWLDAEKDYVQLILRHRDRFEVLTGKLLAEKMEKFTSAAKREMFQAHPEDFVRILPALKPVQREDLYRLLPGLKDLSEGKAKR